jgi:hypothetical protein
MPENEKCEGNLGISTLIFPHFHRGSRAGEELEQIAITCSELLPVCPANLVV